MREKWRQNRELENYEVSNEGRVRNSKTGKVLKPSLDSKGYETVKVTSNGRRITKRVGKLVADTYLGEDPTKPRIKYIDGNKHNNRPDNIELKSRGKKIRVVETGEVYDSISECSKVIGINKSTISKCCNYDFYNNRQGLHFEAVD